MNSEQNDSNQKWWQQFDEAFFNDGYKLADTFLLPGFNEVNLFKAQKQLYLIVDQLIESFLKRTETEGNPSDCKKGCAYCCHQTVLVAPYEMLFLADFLQKKFMQAPLDAIRQKARDKSQNTSNLGLETLLKYKGPCPLLHPTEGYCRAYQARPMACRIYLSSSALSCKADLENPNNDSIFPKLFDMPLRAGRMLNEGFHARIRKDAYETIQAFEVTIDQALDAALAPNAFDQWKNGKPIFKKLKK